MERAASIFLRADITGKDAGNIIDWLENVKITQYLNEDKNAVRDISCLLDNTPVHLLTYHFNRFGRFYVISKKDGNSIGFVKLKEIHTDSVFEIVVAIGNENIWGKGYGSKAVSEALKMVFFEWRAKKVIANIHAENKRSMRVFEKNGFIRESEGINSFKYEITINQFLKRA
jgi:RimJ/RimL family protein N-acetyltransferase